MTHLRHQDPLTQYLMTHFSRQIEEGRARREEEMRRRRQGWKLMSYSHGQEWCQRAGNL